MVLDFSRVQKHGARSHNAQLLAGMHIVRPDPVLHRTPTSRTPVRHSTPWRRHWLNYELALFDRVLPKPQPPKKPPINPPNPLITGIRVSGSSLNKAKTTTIRRKRIKNAPNV